MGRNKPPKNPFPEMETLLEGMQDLLRDEQGNPLPSDHPYCQKVANLMQQINEQTADTGDTDVPSGPEGHA